MNINIPSTLAGHNNFLSEFFEGMVFKLHVNSFKDETVAKDIPILIDRLIEELQEMKAEINGDDDIQPNALTETFDMANFCYLLYEYMRRKGVQNEREQFILENFTIERDGRIYAKRNRSGSRYREGDEIEGTYRKGRCYIRVQDAHSGCAVSLPRDHIVFWYYRGRWPVGELYHADLNPSNDAIENLGETDTAPSKVLPFVSQWRPKGKENHANYGKWCYQRRHRGILVKVGYWDTDEEAAREGTIAWKRKIKEKHSVQS